VGRFLDKKPKDLEKAPCLLCLLGTEKGRAARSWAMAPGKKALACKTEAMA
jgi:hypothetical protein